MSTRNANRLIKSARISAGLTQEKMASGICSVQALSKIELGLTGVSSATFQALMERAGSSCECFPVFENRSDYEVYHLLKIARSYLDSNMLDEAFQYLSNVSQRNFSTNRLHYQEWLLLISSLHLKSHNASFSEIESNLRYAIGITLPDYFTQKKEYPLFSKTECEILILLCYTLIEQKEISLFSTLYKDINSFLNICCFSKTEIDSLSAKLAISYAKLLIHEKKCEKGIELVQYHRAKMIKNADYSSLFELTFLLGLMYCYAGDEKNANYYLNAVIYSSHSIDYCFSTFCIDYLRDTTNFKFSTQLLKLKRISLSKFVFKNTKRDYSSFSNGTFNQDSPTVYTIGELIYDTRLEQNLSQQKLCHGLCSKSKLSKIENKMQQPSISLTEALLQRLGLSERHYTFWGTGKESTYCELKNRLIHSQVTPQEEKEKYLKEISSTIDEKNKIEYQFYLFFKALSTEDIEKKIALLKASLSVTIGELNYYHISEHSLSWCELTILNNLAHTYSRLGNFFNSSLIFKQMTEYMLHKPIEIMLKGNIFCITNVFFSEDLYIQDKHLDNIQFFKQINKELQRKNINLLSFLFFYVCQSFGSLSLYEDCSTYGIYCVQLFNFLDLSPNADILEKYLLDDFGIKLTY